MSNCFSSIHVSCQLLYFVWRQHVQLFFQYTCVLSIVMLCFKATCPTVFPVYMCPVNCYTLFEGNMSNCFSSLHVSCQLLYFVWRQHVQLFFQYTCVLSIVILCLKATYPTVFPVYMCPVNCYTLFEGNMSNCLSSIHVSCQLLCFVLRQHVQLFFQYTCVLSIVMLCLKATYPTVFPVYMCPVNCYTWF